jgi:hypothetical protein
MSIHDTVGNFIKRLGGRAAAGLEEVGIPQISNYISKERALGEALDRRLQAAAADMLERNPALSKLLVDQGKVPSPSLLLGESTFRDPLIQKMMANPEVLEEAANRAADRSMVAGMLPLLGIGGAGTLGAGLAYASEPKLASTKKGCASERGVKMSGEERSRADAFKVGFLRKLAEMGVRPTEFFKRAEFFDVGLSNVVGTGRDIVGTGLDLAGAGAKTLGQAALLAPLLAGAATGTAQALLSSPSPEDIESLRKSEILQLYKRLTDEIRARQQRKGVA